MQRDRERSGRGDQQPAAAKLRLLHRLRADRPTRAAAVPDDDALAKSLPDLLGQNPGGNVGSAAVSEA
jgi:hypothetical protein